MIARLSQVLFAFFSLILIVSCTGEYKNKTNQLVIHIPSDPQSMNPVTYSDNLTGTISKNIFQSMTDVDFYSLKLVPILADSLPVVESRPDGKVFVTNTICNDAEWDNGKPVLATDALFSMKVIKNPLVKASNVAPSFEHVEDILLYPDNPRKFTVVFDTVLFTANIIAGDFPMIPEYLYDPKGLMRSFTLVQLNSQKDQLKSNPLVKEFADDFNSEKRMREKDYIGGSGAYRFLSWETGRQLVLERKKNWWGDKHKDQNCYFTAYPEKLVYRIINDNTTAVNSLKAGALDIMSNILPKDYLELKKNTAIQEKFNFFTPEQMIYVYLGLNTRSPVLRDKQTRQAIGHLVNIEKIIEVVLYGMAIPSQGPIHPTKTKEFHPGIQRYPYDPGKAREMLAAAGWKNTNGDKTIDKIIDGERKEFVVDMVINAGNEIRKQIAIMLRNEAEKLGIEINIRTLEWSVFIENSQNHDFDFTIGGWVSTPVPTDLKSQYHTLNQAEGSNYVNFGTPESDKLLEKIVIEMDEDKRFEMYKRLQEIIHDEAAMVYLYIPRDRIAISKKITNPKVSILRPGYWEAGFQTTETVK